MPATNANDFFSSALHPSFIYILFNVFDKKYFTS